MERGWCLFTLAGPPGLLTTQSPYWSAVNQLSGASSELVPGRREQGLASGCPWKAHIKGCWAEGRRPGRRCRSAIAIKKEKKKKDRKKKSMVVLGSESQFASHLGVICIGSPICSFMK